MCDTSENTSTQKFMHERSQQLRPQQPQVKAAEVFIHVERVTLTLRFTDHMGQHCPAMKRNPALIHAATGKDRENMLREISQVQKALCGNVRSWQIQRRTQTGGCQGLEGLRGSGKSLQMGECLLSQC